jgi:uncharacterized protein YbcI
LESGRAHSPRMAIANQIVKLHSEYYGRGPTRARTYMLDDLVVVVLEETFTAAEKTLIKRGESEPIQNIRRRFQTVMKDQFKSVVEQETGRQVRVFMSETDTDADVSIEIFLLGPPQTDMGAFEPTTAEGVEDANEGLKEEGAGGEARADE